jgi:predicted dehydrogenase
LATQPTTALATALAGARRYQRFEELIAAGEIDLVYVATPPASHCDIVLQAVRAGLHVVCEKPLALRAEDAEDMADAASAAGVVNAVNFPLCYSGTIDAFRGWIVAGNLGQLHHIDIDLAFPVWPRSWQRSAWVASRQQGGPLREVGPHLFHLVLEVFGPVDSVWAAVGYPADAARCERAAVGMLRLESGPLVFVRVMTGSSAAEQVRLLAYGDRGTLGLVDGHRLVASHIPGEGPVPAELRPLPAGDAPPKPLLDRLARAIGGQPAELCDFRAAVKVQRLLDAWLRASVRGGRIDPARPPALASISEEAR